MTCWPSRITLSPRTSALPAYSCSADSRRTPPHGSQSRRGVEHGSDVARVGGCRVNGMSVSIVAGEWPSASASIATGAEAVVTCAHRFYVARREFLHPMRLPFQLAVTGVDEGE